MAVVASLASKGSEKALGWNDSKPTSLSPSTAKSVSPAPSGEAVKVNAITFVPKRNDNTFVVAGIVAPDAVHKLNASFDPEKDPEGAAAALRTLGGVETTQSTYELELEGNRQKPVRITNMRLDANCREPLTDTLFFSPPQGDAPTVKIGFDLDSPNPIAQYAKEHEDGPGFPYRFTGDYFADQKYELKNGEQATFRVTARTFKHYCEFRIRLSLLADSKPATQIIDDMGRPFRISAKVASKDSVGHVWADCSAYKRVYGGGAVNDEQPTPSGWWSARPGTRFC
ncbi:hypothetical protein FXF51_42600 [Nonomuraea sp. PA05]|uniref:hypothetical protein n=1 Tax=Nonomuraea sp. PA05 TaxID=2604466 RepID=UPI0011D961DF|nr:hypothetical protein [Nonomuraea sp. PA05]TYB56803.1 hypothetical protein FXF51_42600 [Nonomuraea sp. PA05]